MQETEQDSLELSQITEQVDRLWSEIRDRRRELQPLLYAAWKLFKGQRGKAGVQVETFKSWLEARGIPRKTGYRMLEREQRKRGERNVQVEDSSVSGDTLDGSAEPFIAALDKGDGTPDEITLNGVPYPDWKLQPRPVEPVKLYDLKVRKVELVARLVELKGQEEADKIIDELIVRELEAQLSGLTPGKVKRLKKQDEQLKGWE